MYSDYGGVAFELDEGQRIANALGSHKACILQNHGLLSVGGSVDEAVWWYISLEKCCQVQLLAEAAAAGKALKLIEESSAQQAYNIVGQSFSGWFQFQALYNRILKETSGDFLR